MRASFFVDQLFDRVRGIGFGKADIDALARQNMAEQRIRGAVELRYRDDIAAQFGEVERRIVQRRLPRTHAQRFQPALERGDAAFEHCGGRIADAAVAITWNLEVEQSGAVVGAVELVGDGLVDGDRGSLGRRLGFIAAVDGNRVAFHASLLQSKAFL